MILLRIFDASIEKMKKTLLVLVLMLSMCIGAYAQSSTASYAVQLSATVNKSGTKYQVNLRWRKNVDVFSPGYKIYRKARNAGAWGQAIATIPQTDTTYTDLNLLNPAQAVEYKIEGNLGTSASTNTFGYAIVGAELTSPADRGILLLVIDDTLKVALASEITRLQNDILADGWNFKTIYVRRRDLVTDVKKLIAAEYTAQPTRVKSIFLLGHVPVPYSGNFNIDGHTDHKGAWPADAYYADINSELWSDISIYEESPARAANKNIPEDGKFDQTILPSALEMQVGRVDFSNMPAFALNEIELTRQYLNKDHNFRNMGFTAREKGLVVDKFGPMGGEAFAASALKSFSAIFGNNNINLSSDYLANVKNQSWLFAYGCGPGSYTSCGNVSNTSDYAKDSTLSVFNMLFGSYFGDYDNTNNILRAVIAAKGYTLTNCWSGRPQWVYHHMAVGETVGYSTWVSQMDYGKYFRYLIFNDTSFRVTTPNLMGDPSLRLHINGKAIETASINAIGKTVVLTWAPNASWSTDIDSVAVFRSVNDGTWRLIAKLPKSITTYTDANTVLGNCKYMMRGQSLKTTGSGSYYNYTPGNIKNINVTTASILSGSQVSLNLAAYPNPVREELNVTWNSNITTPTTLSIRNVKGQEVYFANCKHSNIKIETEILDAGTYFIQVTNQNQTSTIKFVKQ